MGKVQIFVNIFHRLHTTGSELDFRIGSRSAFNVPLGNVSHTTTGKNEVILEFHQNDDAEVSLMEMRFYIPPSENSDTSLEVSKKLQRMTWASVLWSLCNVIKEKKLCDPGMQAPQKVCVP